MKEFLGPDDCFNAPTVPDDDPFRKSEAVRIYNRANIGWKDTQVKLLDDEPSGLRSPSEEYRELNVYTDIFDGMLRGLEREFRGLQLQKSLKKHDEELSPVIDLEAMQVDAKALAYARRYLKIKDCL